MLASLLSSMRRNPGSTSIVPTQDLESAISPRNPGLISVENDFQRLQVVCQGAHYVVIASRTFQ